MTNFRKWNLLILLPLTFLNNAFGQKDSVDARNGGTKTKAPSVMAAADTGLRANGLKKFLLGRNYRGEWTEQVRVSLLDFKTISIKSLKEGGGKETKSLHVEEESGKEYALRSVEKFPEKAVPPEFKGTLSEKLVTDGLSASYPYGVLSMSILSNSAHVPYLKNTLTYIPDDVALDSFRSKYHNMTVLMEESKDPVVFTTSPIAKKGMGTEEVVSQLRDNKNHVDQHSVLRARLLDNFVMDFDRHEGQWDWYDVDSANEKIFYPVPKDRDQVFFVNHGLLSKFITGKTLVPELQGFRAKAKDPVTFNHAAANFDRYFLSGLSRSDWNAEIDEFLASMTDSVIEKSLQQQPAEIQKYSCIKIVNTLKERRKYFKSDMMKYYRFLARTVTIVGTDDPDLFSLTTGAGGMLLVSVCKIGSVNKSTLYERKFDPKETKEIRIYALEGSDSIVIAGGHPKIKVRVIGGPGSDHYFNGSSGGKVIVYDLKEDSNTIAGDHFKNKISSDPMVNLYTRLQSHPYNSFSPGIGFEFSDDGGFYIGASLKMTTQGFRKDPFSTRQSLLISRAANNVSYGIRYKGEFVKIFGKSDLILDVTSRLPTARTLFFGIGNETVFNKSAPEGYKHYLAHYKMTNIALLLRTEINSTLRIEYGPVFQSFTATHRGNDAKYLTEVYAPGHVGIYDTKEYAGGKFSIDVDTRNNAVVPTRGVLLRAYVQSLAGLNMQTQHVTETGGSISIFTDFISKKHVVLATSFGASHLSGNYEFEKAQYLGLLENLRGYRLTRFAGRTRAYNNTEVRFNFGDVNAIFFKTPAGIFLFNDVGRVWADNEKSTIWHDGYGAGIWIAPFRKMVVAGSLGFSNEAKWLPLVTFGFQF